MGEKSARKQSAISLKVKMELLRAVDEKSRSKSDICKEFGIAKSTLSTILRSREQLTEMFERSKFKPDRKRMRNGKHEDMENALLVWFKQARSQNASISGPVLMEKANAFAKEMGIVFTANPGWLERFKKRNGIGFKNIGKAAKKEKNVTEDWLHITLPSILNEYEAKDVFNADESDLLYRCLPDKSFNRQEERVRVLVACNSDGSEKLPLLVIGKHAKPPCFQNVKTLPVDYTANKNASMLGTIFTEWLLKLDKRFLSEKRKVAFIVDANPAHPPVNLKSINLIFLPVNQNVLQPCHQGIIQNMKFYYRKQLLRKYLIALEAKQVFSVSLLDALHMLRSAWHLVTPMAIKNGFCKAGFFKNADLKPTECDDVEPTFSDLFRRLSELVECPLSLDEYAHLDDACIAPILTDSDILELLHANKVDDVDNADAPSASEMRKCISTMRRYFDVNSNGEMNETMDDIEMYVENMIINNKLKKYPKMFLDR